MNNKFLREVRELTHLFFLEYEIDLDLARSNLEERLKDKRKVVKEMTEELIKNKIPEVDQ